MIRLKSMVGVVCLGWALLTAQGAPFGSVPLDSSKSPGSAPVQSSVAPPRVDLGTPPAPVTPMGPGGLRTAETLGVTASDKKWVLDDKGNRYQISSDSLLPPGWTVTTPPAPGQAPGSIPPAPQAASGNAFLNTLNHPSPVGYSATVPANPPSPAATGMGIAGTAPGSAPQTYTSAAQTYTSAPLPAVQPNPYLAQQQPQQPVYQQAMQQPFQQPPTAPTGPPPGKKKLRHKSGYVVYVDKNTSPGPEFEEMEETPPAAGMMPGAGMPPSAYNTAPPQMAPQPQPYSQPQTYAPPQPYAQPQTYGQQPPQPQQQFQPPTNPMLGGLPPQPGQPPVTYQQITAQGQAQTYGNPNPNQSSQPNLSYLPPTWQQQLPYQPSAGQPQGQLAPGNSPYAYSQQPMQPVPIVRGTPPGKKWVADQSGLRYLVDQSTVMGAGMRELTPEEISGPVQMMAPQQLQQQQMMQQQQQQGGGGFGSAIGRFFSGFGK